MKMEEVVMVPKKDTHAQSQETALGEEKHEKVRDKKHHTSKKKHPKIDQKELEALKKEAEEKNLYLDQLKRLKADFENYRKRVFKERDQVKQIFSEDIIFELLPILDNFGHALNSSKVVQDFSTLLQGVEMIYKQLLSLLSGRNVLPIESVGKTFDPNLHEAVSYEVSDAPENQIIDETVKGYTLNGKLLRASIVRVSKGNPSEKESSGSFS